MFLNEDGNEFNLFVNGRTVYSLPYLYRKFYSQTTTHFIQNLNILVTVEIWEGIYSSAIHKESELVAILVQKQT